ncbi:hypothetical protein AB6N23_07185 [Cellulomonas sp. 179-A 9B4 NHS]|uniref:hypothetical protein n=1 Tax=Cellulomonas sp. 179-A 9B4 NHS TaxID=3142379 RepID=UPI0039A1AAD2
MRPFPAAGTARAVAATLTAAAVVALAACTPAADDVAATPTPTPTATASATPTPTPTPEPLEVGGRLDPTPPDSFLGTADTAVIETHTGFDPTNPHYAEVQFTSRLIDVSVADPADLVGVEMTDPVDPATETVYYIRSAHRLEWARTTTVGASGVGPPHVGGWAEDGTGASDLLVMGLFDPCTTGRFDALLPGLEVEACDIAVLPAGVPLTWVGVTENPQVSRDAHEEYEPRPVAWRVG